MPGRKTKPKVATVADYLRELADIFATAARNRRDAIPAAKKLLVEHQKQSSQYLRSMLKQHEQTVAKAQAAIAQINEQLKASTRKGTKAKAKRKS